MKVKGPGDNLGFGDSFIESDYVVSDLDEKETESEVTGGDDGGLEGQVGFEGTPFEE